ncbi:MAG: hypothetical protein E7B11_23635, partial [Clostridiales bacterium]|nr:hypothetical protein [Clostridiales bacterium]MDU3243550.1 hypothetical protein [Clostridiales bacterium]
YLPYRSVFWRIVFDWLPSDTKRALSCEMHQDFAANARVPPKSASGRLENAQICYTPSKPLSWSAPFSFRTPPPSTKRPYSAKPKYNAFNRTL